MHVVRYLHGLGILLRNSIEADLRAEVSIIAQHTTGHLRTQLWVDPRHQHGLLAKGLGHPAGKARVLVGILVPHGDAKGKRNAVAAGTENGTIGSRSQCGLYLLLGGNKVVIILIVAIGNVLNSRKELVALGNVLCHRAGRQYQDTETE